MAWERSWVWWRASSAEEKTYAPWIQKEENKDMFFLEKLFSYKSVHSLQRDAL